MHITKLAAMAFVKDNNKVLFKRVVPLIFLNEYRQFLNCGNDNASYQ